MTVLATFVLPFFVLVAITSASQLPVGINKFETCANQTYSCIDSAGTDDAMLYCCCQDVWFNCRRTLGCDGTGAIKKKPSPESCQYLLAKDRLFSKKPSKVKQCNTVAIKCPNGGHLVQMSIPLAMMAILGALFWSRTSV